MPREKIKLVTIENKSSQQVTLSKRRKGLFKKADELAIMCGAQVAVIVFSAANKLTHYGHPSLEEVITNWNNHADNAEPVVNAPPDIDIEEECEALERKIADEEQLLRIMNEKEYGKLSLKELDRLEEFLRNSLKRHIQHITNEAKQSKQAIEELQNKLSSLKMPSQEDTDMLNYQEAVEKQTVQDGTDKPTDPPVNLMLGLGTIDLNQSDPQL